MKNSLRIFKALSDKTRLRIIRLLQYAGHELCICEIMDSLELAQYNVSKHMRELKAAGLVRERREGKFVMYSLAGSGNDSGKLVLRAVKTISDETVKADIVRLNKRLNLRECGKCVIGSIRKKGV